MVCGCRPVKSRGAGWTGLGPRSGRCRPGHSVPGTDVTGENPASPKGQSWAERTSGVASAAGFPEARHWCLPCGRWALEGAPWELQPDAWGASTLPGEERTRLGCPWLHLVHSQQGTAGVPSEPWSPCQAAGCWAEQACGRSKPAGAGSAQPGPGEAGFPQLTARTCMAGLQRQGHCRGCGTCQAMGRELGVACGPVGCSRPLWECARPLPRPCTRPRCGLWERLRPSPAAPAMVRVGVAGVWAGPRPPLRFLPPTWVPLAVQLLCILENPGPSPRNADPGVGAGRTCSEVDSVPRAHRQERPWP